MMIKVPSGEKPSSYTLGVGSVVMMWPVEASMTETLRTRVSDAGGYRCAVGLLFGRGPCKIATVRGVTAAAKIAFRSEAN